MGRLRSPAGHERELRVPNPLATAAPVAAAAVVALAFAAVGDVPETDAFAATAGLLGFAVLRGLLAARDRSALRRTADALLRTGVKVHPQSALLVWRAAELTSDRKRKILAGSLSGIARDLEQPPPISAVPLNRRAVRPHLELVRALAARLAALDLPVAPKGMVLLEQLLTDGCTSPLYIGGSDADVEPALKRCLSALDGDRGAGGRVTVGVAERPAEVGRSFDHWNRVHSGGSR